MTCAADDLRQVTMALMNEPSMPKVRTDDDQRSPTTSAACKLRLVTAVLILLILAASHGVASPELHSIGVATTAIVLASRNNRP